MSFVWVVSLFFFGIALHGILNSSANAIFVLAGIKARKQFFLFSFFYHISLAAPGCINTNTKFKIENRKLSHTHSGEVQNSSTVKRQNIKTSRPQASTSPSWPTQLKQQVLSSSCTSSYSGPFSGGRSLEAKCLSGGLGHHLAEVLLAWVSLAHLVPLLPCSPPLPSSYDFSWVCLVNILQKKMKILSPGKQKGKGHCKWASNYCSSEPYIVTFFRQQGHDFKFLSPWCSLCSWFLFGWGGHQVHGLFQCSWYSRCRWCLLSQGGHQVHNSLQKWRGVLQHKVMAHFQVLDFWQLLWLSLARLEWKNLTGVSQHKPMACFEV